MVSTGIRSKKRSATKSLPDITFFIDRCLGKKVAAALTTEYTKIEVHDNHFPPDERDQVWLASVGARGWVVLTKDKNIRRNHLERGALRDAGVKAFILTSPHLTAVEMCAVLKKALPKMAKLAGAKRLGFIALIHKNGRIQTLETFSRRRSDERSC